jgi:hypothetical protein
VALGTTVFDGKVLALAIAELTQSVQQQLHQRRILARQQREVADPGGLLGGCGCRP